MFIEFVLKIIIIIFQIGICITRKLQTILNSFIISPKLKFLRFLRIHEIFNLFFELLSFHCFPDIKKFFLLIIERFWIWFLFKLIKKFLDLLFVYKCFIISSLNGLVFLIQMLLKIRYLRSDFTKFLFIVEDKGSVFGILFVCFGDFVHE